MQELAPAASPVEVGLELTLFSSRVAHFPLKPIQVRQRIVKLASFFRGDSARVFRLLHNRLYPLVFFQ
ncbi:MAG: hypothetical protein ACRD36_08510, partial [Candidatus Acidiferrum sp.]